MIVTGYFGLVAGASLSEFGCEVVCIDTDAAKAWSCGPGAFRLSSPANIF
jgi:UDP-glucose 6-dehydrogenase